MVASREARSVRSALRSCCRTVRLMRSTSRPSSNDDRNRRTPSTSCVWRVRTSPVVAARSVSTNWSWLRQPIQAVRGDSRYAGPLPARTACWTSVGTTLPGCRGHSPPRRPTAITNGIFRAKISFDSSTSSANACVLAPPGALRRYRLEIVVTAVPDSSAHPSARRWAHLLSTYSTKVSKRTTARAAVPVSSNAGESVTRWCGSTASR